MYIHLLYRYIVRKPHQLAKFNSPQGALILGIYVNLQEWRNRSVISLDGIPDLLNFILEQFIKHRRSVNATVRAD